MKRTQKILALLLALVLIFAVAGCSAGKSADSTSAELSRPQEAPAPEAEYSQSADMSLDSGNGSNEGGDFVSQNSSEKIIYSGSATVETLEFDTALEKLAKMIEDCGGFIQSSYVSGSNYYDSYYNRETYRSAEYSIRIPSAGFASFTDSLESLGNVPYSSTNAENITMQYRDTEARLTARKTEETRLLELLSKADTVEDMLKIEGYLSDVRYEIESLTSQIKNWDSLVSYSTLSLTLNEVIDYTQKKPSAVGYGQQLKEGFLRSLENVGSFFKSLFKWLITSLPVLVLIAAVAVAAFFIVRRIIRKHRINKSSGDRMDD